MYKAVFFDVGSTLLAPNPDIDGVFYEVVLKRGHKVDRNKITSVMPLVNQFYEDEYLKDGDFWCSHEGSVEIYLDMYRYLSFLTGFGEEAEEIAHEVHACYLRAQYWKIYQDVLPCLKGLKMKHLKLGVVSNWSSNLEDLLRELLLKPYFEEVISSADVGYRKPNPMIFTILLERLGLMPHEAIHVGDRPDADGVGASEAGVTPIIIDRQNKFANCGYMRVTSLKELVSIVS